MKVRWLLSAVAVFSLLAYLGIWGYSIWFDKEDIEGLPLEPPMRTISTMPELSEPPQESHSQADQEPLPEIEEDLVRKIGFEISETEVDPGGFLVLSAYGVTHPDQLKVSNPFGVNLKFYPEKDHFVALLPVKYTYSPGRYLLSAEGDGYQESFTITVRNKAFETQELTVEQGTVDSTINSNSANDEYFSRVQPIKFEADAQALWQGNFILPVEGRLTTSFGMRRITNGVPGDRHGGIDLAAETGTPIVASNAGRVLFSDLIALTGNTICIDHGMGLKSWYYHMDSRAVKVGEMVSQGQKIGEVGSTGFSTGPHLHFATSIWNIYIDPQLLFDGDFQL